MPIRPLIQRVLYVEDHPVNVLLMQALLERRPQARLLVATSAAEGLALALAQPPDLMLLDLRLPDGHGTELLRRMRGHASLADVPAVALTAEDTGDLARHGFAEVWRKPMDLQLVLGRLDRLLQRVAHACGQATQALALEHPRHPSAAPRPIPFPGAAR